MGKVYNSDNSYNSSSDIKEETVCVRRVCNVVKGGRRFSFYSMVVAGDGHSRVGYGKGKDNEVINCRSKAARKAKKKLMKVPLRDGRSFHYKLECKVGATKIVVWPAPEGTGIRSCPSLRIVFEQLGVTDVVAKCYGSTNSINVVRALFRCLKAVNSPKDIADKRGKTIGEIVSRRSFR